ncbi:MULTISPECIES: DUF1090 domain-containing protein [unclassified Gilliamella]|uniref:DUF1090 domain-containing protein n=1 Tax=unclassified Gilliamella TaxID=2685620 RepID=UPI00080DA5E8|nr:DUF1090 domain-containing protein [Gilliamella apicola]MCO6553772.1 DUF1090 domain-containing protein [Gilliamella sp.]OCG36333.1 hypothetical protein A9G32_05650 [Gilliamella apicola]OCG52687.1 hypothetical protein A9G26_01350 [Gilliamella apicola]OCG54336.1 hypothetical protein A9G27_07000 [Gilliamella apicola]
MKSVIRLVSKLSVITLAISLSFGAYASNEQLKGLTCESKKQAIEKQIDYAKKNNNSHQIQGLEKSLRNLNKHCSNDDLEAKYKKEINEKSNKVAERTKELEQAKSKSKAKDKDNEQKIVKQQTKLADAEKELNKAKTKLSDFYKELGAK